MLRPALIVHGGAGGTDPTLSDAQEAGCRTAVAAGWRILLDDGSALDAVCAAVAVLEDDPAFNAGVGSCLTNAGTVEMDASVMDGNGWRAGAVGLLRTVRHPVYLARTLLEDGHALFLAGPEADAFAQRRGLPTCRPEELITTRQQERWQRHHAPSGTAKSSAAGGGTAGTVGAVAVDNAGHVAAATSTGGIFDKLAGRVGDSAIIGAGTYADDRGGASATGVGEAIIRVTLAKSVVDALRDGADPDGAARQGIRRLARQVGGSGGIIVVDGLGRLGYACSTPHMAVGYMRADLPAPVVRV